MLFNNNGKYRYEDHEAFAMTSALKAYTFSLTMRAAELEDLIRIEVQRQASPDFTLSNC